MPRGPLGEKRPANVIGAAVVVARIPTGEIDDPKTEKNPHAAALGHATLSNPINIMKNAERRSTRAME